MLASIKIARKQLVASHFRKSLYKTNAPAVKKPIGFILIRIPDPDTPTQAFQHSIAAPAPVLARLAIQLIAKSFLAEFQTRKPPEKAALGRTNNNTSKALRTEP